MHLYLLRHGEAEQRQHDDPSRSLTAHGRQQVRDVAHQFASRHIALTACYYSPFVRTSQTCSRFLTEAGSALTPQALNLLTPSHRASQVLGFLNGLQQEHVLLVTHNPLVSELLAELTDTPIEAMHVFATGELNAVNCEAVVHGGGIPEFRLSPKD